MTDADACDPDILTTLDYMVLAFRRRYGGDVDELRCEANYCYVLACHSFDGRGELSGWIRYKVWKGLHSMRRRERRRWKFFPPSSQMIPLNKLEARDVNRWQRLLAELSDDAKTIVQLLVGEHVDCLLPQRMRQQKKVRPISKLDAVVRFLREIGWTGKEILESVKEIGEVLSC